MTQKSKKTVINNSRTRADNAKVQAEYTEENKRVKRRIRADRGKYDLATKAGKAASKENIRQLYNTTKKVARK